MPFSTACSTPLSNFEVGQNYKEVNDPASKYQTFSIFLSVAERYGLDIVYTIMTITFYIHV